LITIAVPAVEAACGLPHIHRLVLGVPGAVNGQAMIGGDQMVTTEPLMQRRTMSNVDVNQAGA
jgi:hypothetical protein